MSVMLRWEPDPTLPADQQDKRSVIPIEPPDIDVWLHGSLNDATRLLRLTPVECFAAAPVA